MSESEAKTEALPATTGADLATEPTPAPLASSATTTPSQEFKTCDECGAPLDQTQRYCVNCGAHRGDTNDPAARYLGEASARARRGNSGPVTATAAGVRRPPDWFAAIAIALVPVAAAVGVAIGRSSNSQDSALIRALAKERTSIVSAGATTASTTSPSNAKKSSKKSNGGKTPASTQTKFGGTSQITGAKVTKSEVQQGAADAQKELDSSGKGYVQGENTLPTTVIP
jgi:hypothetical protein